MQGRMTPRLIGFLTEIEREFFELFCSVDGVGVKKALRSMVRPVKEVATAIEEQDTKSLSALPGIGAAMSERIIAKLRRKVPKFALMVAGDEKRRGRSRARRDLRNLRRAPQPWPQRKRGPKAHRRRVGREKEIQGRAKPDRGDLSAKQGLKNTHNYLPKICVSENVYIHLIILSFKKAINYIDSLRHQIF